MPMILKDGAVVDVAYMHIGKTQRPTAVISMSPIHIATKCKGIKYQHELSLPQCEGKFHSSSSNQPYVSISIRG